MRGPPEDVQKTSVALVEFPFCDFLHADVVGLLDDMPISCGGATRTGGGQTGHGCHTPPPDPLFEKLAAGECFSAHLIFLLKESIITADFKPSFKTTTATPRKSGLFHPANI